MGPKNLVGFAFDTNGRVSNQLAGTQVLFDGTPAPLIYTSDAQVSPAVRVGQSLGFRLLYTGAQPAASPRGQPT